MQNGKQHDRVLKIQDKRNQLSTLSLSENYTPTDGSVIKLKSYIMMYFIFTLYGITKTIVLKSFKKRVTLYIVF